VVVVSGLPRVESAKPVAFAWRSRGKLSDFRPAMAVFRSSGFLASGSERETSGGGARAGMDAGREEDMTSAWADPISERKPSARNFGRCDLILFSPKEYEPVSDAQPGPFPGHKHGSPSRVLVSTRQPCKHGRILATVTRSLQELARG